MQRSLTESLVRRRLHWTGYVERMADDSLQKRPAELREQCLLEEMREAKADIG